MHHILIDIICSNNVGQWVCVCKKNGGWWSIYILDVVVMKFIHQGFWHIHNRKSNIDGAIQVQYFYFHVYSHQIFIKYTESFMAVFWLLTSSIFTLFLRFYMVFPNTKFFISCRNLFQNRFWLVFYYQYWNLYRTSATGIAWMTTLGGFCLTSCQEICIAWDFCSEYISVFYRSNSEQA